MGGQEWKQRNARKCHEIKRISKILQHPKINPGSAPEHDIKQIFNRLLTISYIFTP